MGTLRPTPGFTFGSQRDVRDEAARRGWLTLFQEFNQQYTAVKNQQLDVQASLTLIPDLTIDLNATRVFSETYSENYRVTPNSLDYQSLNPYSFGNFTISTILVRQHLRATTRPFHKYLKISERTGWKWPGDLPLKMDLIPIIQMLKDIP
jgi:cell surface protein SprA